MLQGDVLGGGRSGVAVRRIKPLFTPISRALQNEKFSVMLSTHTVGNE